MDYEIFDTNAILLGLLSAVLAAECIILFFKAQSMRRRLDTEVESVCTQERAKAENRKNELESELKERALRLENEYDALLAENRKNKADLEGKLAKVRYDLEGARLASKQAKDEYEYFKKLSAKCAKLTEDYTKKIVEVSELDTETLHKQAREAISQKCAKELESYHSELFKKSAKELELEARRVLADAISRSAASVNSEMNTCIVKLPSEAMKGRLIGKEGRNIRTFEAASETTLVIDETPDSVMISSFDPSRREIARIALERLLRDGRINPATIESALASAKSEIEKNSIDYGRSAAEQTNVKGLHPEILSTLGSLRFHLSLNQNTLEHSIEAARLAAALASEIDCDFAIAKRAALLHDIGKACESELSHARSGAQLLRRFGENEIVANAVEAHHGEVVGGLYGAIVQIADTISATRTGARMTPAEGYFMRMKNLEDIALSFEGVLSAYALQAGRELRVIVEPNIIDDAFAAKIAVDMRDRIAESTDNSVPVKITLIRERRFVENT